MLSSKKNAEICASEIMDSIPAVMRFIRGRIRKRWQQVSLPQVRALSFIHQSPNCSLSELSDFMGVSNASTCSLVDRLVQKGLVSRIEDPKERRCVLLSLTENGLNQYSEIRQFSIEQLVELLSFRDQSELNQIKDGLITLRNLLRESE